MTLINKPALVGGFFIFVSYFVIGLWTEEYDLRPDLVSRIDTASEGCPNYEFIFLTENVTPLILYVQGKIIADTTSCIIFANVLSKSFALYVMPPLLGLFLYLAIVAFFSAQRPDERLPYVTVYLILMFPTVALSVGEHFKSTIGMLFLLMSLASDSKRRGWLFISLAFISHVTSLISFVMYRIIDLNGFWIKWVAVSLFSFFCLGLNFLFLDLGRNAGGSDFQTVLVVLLGLTLSINIRGKDNIYFNPFPLLVLMLLGSTYIGGRAIISAAPLLLAQGVLRNNNMWLILIPSSLLSLYFII